MAIKTVTQHEYDKFSHHVGGDTSKSSVYVRDVDSGLTTKITVSGSNTFIGVAAPGTAQSTAQWQCKKIAVSGGDTTITWADGNINFDNTASDLTALSYS